MARGRRGRTAARALLVVALAVVAWQSLVPPEQIAVSVGSDKLAHVLGYALLGALAALSLSRRAAAWALIVAFGLVLEIAQATTPYRSFEWLDLVADGIGAAIGAFAVVLTGRLRRG